jgi:GxxExxY protein
MESKTEERKVVLPELSYKIMGALFSVGNTLPWGLPEKDFQKALATVFSQEGIPFKREVYIPVKSAESLVGKYFADFVIDEKVILELKVVARMGYAQVRQLLTYLRAGGYKLGMLIYFTKDGVKYRRVLNPDI